MQLLFSSMLTIFVSLDVSYAWRRYLIDEYIRALLRCKQADMYVGFKANINLRLSCYIRVEIHAFSLLTDKDVTKMSSD